MASPSISDRPSIAIVIPSFNQASYLEAAIRSVIEQAGVSVETVVMDGGSTDGSLEIIRKYEDRLSGWTSGPDGGQYAAVQAGIARTGADLIGWLNSDDAYLPGALAIVVEIFARFPEIEWLTSTRPLFWDRAGRAVRSEAVTGYARAALLSGEHLPRAGEFAVGWIQQESTFWRRSLWDRAGSTFTEYPLAGDFALWTDFSRHADLIGVDAPLGGFRVHGDQKTGRAFAEYCAEAERALRAAGGRRGSAFWRCVRQAALRMPVACWPALHRLGLLHRTRVVRFDLREDAWKLERRFI